MNAQNNLLSIMPEFTNKITDDSNILSRYDVPSEATGTVASRKVTYLWDYIKEKISSMALKISNMLVVSNSGANNKGSLVIDDSMFTFHGVKIQAKNGSTTNYIYINPDGGPIVLGSECPVTIGDYVSIAGYLSADSVTVDTSLRIPTKAPSRPQAGDIWLSL